MLNYYRHLERDGTERTMDETQFSGLPELSHYLTHLYANWAGTVPQPNMVYYADRACTWLNSETQGDSDQNKKNFIREV